MLQPRPDHRGRSPLVVRVWQAIAKRIDAVWGYDVFVAHRRVDGAVYAQALHDQLTADNVRCFIDKNIYKPGDYLPAATQRHAAKSTVLVVVASPGLLETRSPDWVKTELDVYRATHRDDPKVFVIDFDATVAGNPQHLIAAEFALFVRETAEKGDLQRAPAASVVKAVKDQLRGRRVERVRLRWFQGIAVVLFVFAVSTGVAAYLAYKQRNEASQLRQVADHRYQSLLRQNRTLGDFFSEIEGLAGSTEFRRSVALKALEQLEVLRREEGTDPIIRRDIAAGYLRLGDAQGLPGSANLGDSAGAIRSYDAALTILESVAHDLPNDLETLRQLVAVNLRVGGLWKAGKDQINAKKSFGKALDIAGRLAQLPNASLDIQKDLASAHGELAALLADSGDIPQAIEHFGIAEQRFRAIMNHEHVAPTIKYAFAKYLMTVGVLNANRIGNSSKALQYYTEALQILEGLVSKEPANSVGLRTLSSLHSNIAGARGDLGQTSEAAKELLQALSIDQRLVEMDPKNATAVDDLAVTHNDLGDLQFDLGNLDSASEHYQEGYRLRKSLENLDRANNSYSRRVTLSIDQLGRVAMKTGNYQEALRRFEMGLAIRRKLSSSNPGDTRLRRELGFSWQHMGEATGEIKAASSIHWYRSALEVFESLALDQANKQAQGDLIFILNSFASMLGRSGEFGEADRLITRAVTLLQEAARDKTADFRDLEALTHFNRGVLLASHKTGDPAVELKLAARIREELAAADQESNINRENLAISYQELGDYYFKRGECNLAQPFYARAHTIWEKMKTLRRLYPVDVRRSEALKSATAVCAARHKRAE